MRDEPTNRRTDERNSRAQYKLHRGVARPAPPLDAPRTAPSRL